ncbi:MAG: hypothetical protein GOV01_00085 [Candidatus Altiarchaeota archaeon]|nr:hypothetical protein [Candidatus Altiarchaeota archaeon]
MKGQIFELLFYPHIAVLLLFFFSFMTSELISETVTLKSVLAKSNSAIASSNLNLLNCTPDHHTGFCNTNTETGTYYIRRLVSDGTAIKELIFPNTN